MTHKISTMFANARRLHVSLALLAVAILLLPFSDLSISTLYPLMEIKRFFGGLLQMDLGQIDSFAQALLNTVTIAIVSIVIASLIGFAFALVFHIAIVRAILAFLRAIHELFWALIFLQIFGLSTLTALLAIIIPYSAILGKVYAEILEEHDKFPSELRAKNASNFILFIYTKLPDALPHLISYTIYRFECALKSTAILGFIGLSTLGYYLEGAFMQGQYGEVWLLLILFYLLIASIKYWFRKYTVPFFFFASLFALEESPAIKIENLTRFFTQDIVPSPIKQGKDFSEFFTWFWDIISNELFTGTINTIIVTQLALVFTAIVAFTCIPLISNILHKHIHRFGGSFLLVILRSTPEYILAYLFLQLFGPSMLPAVLALALHNGAIIAFITGKQSNELKLRVDASKRFVERYSYEVIPRIYGSFMAFLFYRWEVVMRESAILGILGIQTLGFFIDSAIADFRLDKMAILLVFTAFLNIFIDFIARKMRHYIHVNKKIKSTAICSIS